MYLAPPAHARRQRILISSLAFHSRTLPNELLKRILFFLSRKDKQSVRLVSRQFRQLVDCNVKWGLRRTDEQKSDLDTIKHFFQHSTMPFYVERLEITAIARNLRTRQLMQMLPASFSTLTLRFCGNKDGPDVSTICSSLPQSVTALLLIAHDGELPSVALHSLPTTLQTLTIHSRLKFSEPLQLPPALVELHLPSLPGYSAKYLPPTLKVFSLEDASQLKLSEENLLPTSIQTLSLQYQCVLLTPAHFLFLPCTLCKISLSWAECHGFKDVAKLIPRLLHLTFSKITQLLLSGWQS